MKQIAAATRAGALFLAGVDRAAAPAWLGFTRANSIGYRCRALAAAAILGLSATACVPSAITASKHAVAERLKDPSSAQFTDVREDSAGSVCGEVNGKNSFGAYDGNARFVVTIIGDTIAQVQIDPKDRGIRTELFEASWDSFCK